MHVIAAGCTFATPGLHGSVYIASWELDIATDTEFFLGVLP